MYNIIKYLNEGLSGASKAYLKLSRKRKKLDTEANSIKINYDKSAYDEENKDYLNNLKSKIELNNKKSKVYKAIPKKQKRINFRARKNVTMDLRSGRKHGPYRKFLANRLRFHRNK